MTPSSYTDPVGGDTWSGWTDGALRWRTRGTKLDTAPECFVCGIRVRNVRAAVTAHSYFNSLAALVRKSDRDAALACFDRGARLSYSYDPQALRIVVGACDRHLEALERLAGQLLVSPAVVRRVVSDALAQETPYAH